MGRLPAGGPPRVAQTPVAASEATGIRPGDSNCFGNETVRPAAGLRLFWSRIKLVNNMSFVPQEGNSNDDGIYGTHGVHGEVFRRLGPDFQRQEIGGRNHGKGETTGQKEG